MNKRIFALAFTLICLTLAGCGEPELRQIVATPPAAAMIPLPPTPRLIPASTPAVATPTADPTAPPTPAASAYTFAVVGDTGDDTTVLRRVVSEVRQHGDAFLIVLGDITTDGSRAQIEAFQRVVQQAGVPVYVAPGNHEYLGNGMKWLAQYYPRHTSFDNGAAHFTIVDDGSYKMDSEELAWLDNDLSNTNQPLKFVFCHIPPEAPYNLPLGDDKLLQGGAIEFSTMLAAHKVNILFAGHLHAYEQYDGEGGVQRIITGGGGEQPQIPAWLGGYYNYVRVTVSGNRATAQDIEIKL